MDAKEGKRCFAGTIRMEGRTSEEALIIRHFCSANGVLILINCEGSGYVAYSFCLSESIHSLAK